MKNRKIQKLPFAKCLSGYHHKNMHPALVVSNEKFATASQYTYAQAPPNPADLCRIAHGLLGNLSCYIVRLYIYAHRLEKCRHLILAVADCTAPGASSGRS